MVALQVGDQVTIRPLSLKTIERQRRQQEDDQALVKNAYFDVVIRAPFNFVGVVMTVEELKRDEAYCRVYDLRVRLNVMHGKSMACIARKYLKRVKQLPR